MSEIQEQYRAKLRQLASNLDEIFNGPNLKERKVGFALLVFEFGTGNFLNYISNTQRQDMIVAMREFIALSEGTYSSKEGHS